MIAARPRPLPSDYRVAPHPVAWAEARTEAEVYPRTISRALRAKTRRLRSGFGKKRGEIELEHLSSNLIVQLGLVTEELARKLGFKTGSISA
jgi:hypothetical protein